MAAGESIVGSILGYLRLDADQFHREIEKAIVEADLLDGKNVDVKIRTTGADSVTRSTATASRGLDSVTAASRRLEDATGRVQVARLKLDEVRSSGSAKASAVVAAEHALAKALRDENDAVWATYDGNINAGKSMRGLERDASRAAKSMEGFGRSSGRIPGGAPVLIAGIATAIALIGPVAGAATAGIAGVTGVLGAGILAWKGYQREIEKGTALGTNLNGRLDETKSALQALEATSARAMAPGLLSGLATLNQFLPALNGDVESLGKHLGNALSISASGLVSGLRTAMPLLDDGGRYAEILAQKFADFAQSQDFKDFIAYARRELPVVITSLVELTKGVASLAEALAPIGDAAVRSIGALGHALSVVSPLIKDITSHGGGDPLLLDRNGKAIKNIDEYRFNVEQASAAVGDHTVAVQRMNPELLMTANLMGTTTTALVAAEDAQNKNAQAIAATTLKMQVENDAAGLLKQSLDLLNGKALSAADAQNAFDSSLVNMGTHTTATGKKVHFTSSMLHGMSAAAVALRGQLNNQVEGLQRVVEANGGLTSSTGKGRAEMIRMRKQIIDNAVAHGVDRKAVTDYVDSLLKIPPTVPPTKLEVDKTEAERKLYALQKQINDLHGKNLTVSVSVLTGTLNKLASNPRLSSANGNIFPSVRPFASGGFENHVAQIAPAGAMRLWAEPETGGEAYIPLAPSKRARSMAIWEETGRRLGVEGGVPAVYVQNPFTGEYLLAQAAGVADQRIAAHAGSVGRSVASRPR